MSGTISTDLCVIGAGASGLPIAAGAARLGIPTVLVEREAGSRPDIDMPAQILPAIAGAAQAMREAGAFALPPSDPQIDWPAIRARIRATAAGLAPGDSAVRYRALGVNVIEAAAGFTGRRTIRAGDTIVRARRFVIATGAAPVVPAIPGLETVRWLTRDTISDLDMLPSHLLVLGAGPRGLELAQAFRRLGSAVTVVDVGRPLAREDEEMGRPVLDALRREGVAIRARTSVRAVEPGENGSLRLRVETGGTDEWIAGSHLLLAVGRTPRVENLGLERAGVPCDAGGIKVGRDLRTANPRIFATGGVIGGPRQSHVGAHQATLVLRKALFRLPARFVASAMPRVTFTQPQLAAVGLDEEAARKTHRHIRIFRAPLGDTDRARIEGVTAGHVKIVTTRRGKVLGAAIVGDHAAELLTPWSLAVASKLALRDIAQMVVPCPTRSEASRQVALEFYTGTFDRPSVQRMLHWIRRLG